MLNIFEHHFSLYVKCCIKYKKEFIDNRIRYIKIQERETEMGTEREDTTKSDVKISKKLLGIIALVMLQVSAVPLIIHGL